MKLVPPYILVLLLLLFKKNGNYEKNRGKHEFYGGGEG